MGYTNTITLLFLTQFLMYFVHLTVAQPGVDPNDFLGWYCIPEDRNFTYNSVYRSNLDTALSSVKSSVNTTIYGFNTTSVGQDPNLVNVLALCRGDVDPVTCGQCVYNSTLKLREVCPNRTDGIVWYEFCTVSYFDSFSIITYLDENMIPLRISDPNSVTDADQFNENLTNLLNSLRGQAAGGGQLRKFATGNARGPYFLDIYGLMQCTPNLSEEACDRCLTSAIQDIPNCCSGRRGGRVIKPSCNLRFGTSPFFQATHGEETPPPQSLSPLPLPLPPPGEDDNTKRRVIITVVPIIVFVFLLVGIWIFTSKRKKKKKPKETLRNVDDVNKLESLQYDLGTLRIATNNFSDTNKLGQGGFWVVYKGKLPNGIEIAVKRLAENSRQAELEYKNEVVLLAKLQHRNLVRLLGFCLEGTESFLIYEFVPNASLDHFIFDSVNKADLDWNLRYNVIRGVARGLLYLHEDSRPRIIHRNLKASKVLLDSEMNPKIADFGVARLFEREDEIQGSTSRIVGTYGYMAPEYAFHGKFSDKSDVFSFGVLVLEIVSGQRNNGLRNEESAEDLLSSAWKKWQGQRCSDFIDPVMSSSPIRDVTRCIHIGLLCVQENVGDRPTMASIVLMLNRVSIALPIPSEPAFFMTFGPENSQFGEYSYSVASRSIKRNN